VDRRRAGLVAAAAAILAGVLALMWYRGRPLDPAAQIKRLPAADSVILYIDFDQLRRGGFLKLLDAPKGAEEEEYRKFAERIHLDWRQDLHTAMLAFAPSGKYMLVKGRFDWKSLQSYATSSGGDCEGSFCRMTGSTRDRRISFFPLRDNLLALAVSTDEMAAKRMTGIAPGPDTELPDAPVWMRIPGSVLKSGESLPSGTRMFARTVEQADFVTLMFVPEGDRLAAKLDVLCRDDGDAAAMAAELTRATGLLRDLIQREHVTPNPADFSGVLTSGTFRGEGRRVIGHWPIERAFVENLLSGGA
jgi:hypothetical protein